MNTKITAIALTAALTVSAAAIPAAAVEDGAQALVDEYASGLYLSSDEVEAMFSIYSYLRDDMGLNTAAAAGVIANVYAECSFNVDDDNGTALGIVQWTGSNRTGEIDWCEDNGYDPWSLSGQLTYLSYQLDNISWYSGVNYDMHNLVENSSDGAHYAGWYWCYYYEIPADRDGQADRRADLAQDIFYPIFEELEGEGIELTFSDAGEEPFVFPFEDVTEDDWYYDAVWYAAEKGLFAGTTESTFSPDTTMTRAQLLTVLYRLDGCPEVSGTSSFEDVDESAWYYGAAVWAEQTGLFTDFESIADMWTEQEEDDNCLHPNELLTREQLVVWLFNYYAVYKGNAAYNFTELDEFADMESLTFGTDAMRWAVGNGVVNGSTNAEGEKLLKPTSPCSRAQVAVMLTNMIENLMQE